MNKYPYSVRVCKLAEDDGGGYYAWTPELPGCSSDGETKSEALDNLDEAIECWLETANEFGYAIPEPEIYAEEVYSGKLSLRLPKTLHAQVAAYAKQEECSINQLLTTYIAAGCAGQAQKADERVRGRVHTAKFSILPAMHSGTPTSP